MLYYDGLQVILRNRSERIYTEFRDNNRLLVNPVTPRVVIYNPNGIEFASGAPTQESTGIYYFVVTATASTLEGIFSAYWRGSIGGAAISMDVPQYFWVQQEPVGLDQPSELIQSIRRFIGDTNPNNYRIATQDIHYFLKDAVNEVQSTFSMGYTISVTPAAVTFNKAVTRTPETLFRIKTAELIMASVLTDALFSGVNLSLGDVKVSMGETIRLRQEYIKQLRDQFAILIKNIKMAGNATYGGILINNYLMENSQKYNLNYMT